MGRRSKQTFLQRRHTDGQKCLLLELTQASFVEAGGQNGVGGERSKCVPNVPFVEDKKNRRTELSGAGKPKWLLLFRLGKWA